MSDLDPRGPSQPSQDQAYTTPGNQATKNPSEQSQTNLNSRDNAPAVDQRIPTKQNGEDQARGGGWGLGRGVQGAGAGEESKGLTQDDVGRHRELDGEQMAAPGEGRVADAVSGRSGHGVGGEQVDLAADLDRKKAEQAPLRKHIQEERKEKVDVGGILGQRGGPANPVDKNNYPNTGD